MAGVSSHNQAGRTAFMKPGNMVLLDSRLPYSGILESAGSGQLLSILRIPHDEIICRIPCLEDVTMVVLDPRKKMTQLVYDMVRSLHKQSQPGEMGQNTILANTVLDNVTAAALSSFQDRDCDYYSRSNTLLWRVKSYIDAHLLENDLDPERIASAHNVTARYLNRLFAREDTSITRWVRRRRLERCAEMLHTSWHMKRNINDVAYLCGFNSLPYFYLSFKQHYGCTPSEYRLNALIPGRERQGLPNSASNSSS